MYDLELEELQRRYDAVCVSLERIKDMAGKHLDTEHPVVLWDYQATLEAIRNEISDLYGLDIMESVGRTSPSILEGRGLYGENLQYAIMTILRSNILHMLDSSLYRYIEASAEFRSDSARSGAGSIYMMVDRMLTNVNVCIETINHPDFVQIVVQE